MVQVGPGQDALKRGMLQYGHQGDNNAGKARTCVPSTSLGLASRTSTCSCIRHHMGWHCVCCAAGRCRPVRLCGPCFYELWRAGKQQGLGAHGGTDALLLEAQAACAGAARWA